MNRIREQRPSSALVVACAALIALTAWSPTAAFGTTGEITRADASPDWLHGSIAGYVSGLPPAGWGEKREGIAFVQPSSYACDSLNPYYVNSPYGGDKRVKPAWYGTTSFDIADFPLDGSYGQRVCLYEHHEYLTLPDGGGYYVLLADRQLTVPQPPPAPPTQSHPVVTLSRATALSKAKSALKRQLGKAYKRGKRKRLSCARQSSTRYRCTFSFRYRKKRQKGIVTVAIEPDGSFTTKIKRR